MQYLIKRILFTTFLSIFFCFCILQFFLSIFQSSTLIIPYSLKPFDICKVAPKAWYLLKILYVIFSYISCLIISNSIFVKLFKKPKKYKNCRDDSSINNDELNLYIGTEFLSNKKVFIPEKGLFQNILVTGTIGSGKTSSFMYPITKQLIEFESHNINKKLGLLILDVKGNYYAQVKEYAKNCGRENDLVIIELGGSVKYNPLHKPNLKPSILANRLKTILTLFSPNNTESYWLDKAEEVIAECIKLCRLYNNNYVTFMEIHKLINMPNYYLDKISSLRESFQKNMFSAQQVYDLKTSLEFFENEFHSLDSRVLSILKSEITRITNTFISDYDVINTFSPPQTLLNFYGFKQLIDEGKIVVLNMNISEYRNLSKIIATYLKLDFQTEVMSQLSHNGPKRITAFISDEFHEYVSSIDSEFFAQSREAKCINIVATQSYTSLQNSLKDPSCVKVIVQNLINKIWFRTDDMLTIEDAQKQIGREEKTRISNTISENSKTTKFNYLTNSLNSTDSNLSESINTYTQLDFAYDTNFFTQNLETFSCLSFLSTGTKIRKPQKLKLIPYFLLEPPLKKDSLNTYTHKALNTKPYNNSKNYNKTKII